MYDRFNMINLIQFQYGISIREYTIFSVYRTASRTSIVAGGGTSMPMIGILVHNQLGQVVASWHSYEWFLTGQRLLYWL